MPFRRVTCDVIITLRTKQVLKLVNPSPFPVLRWLTNRKGSPATGFSPSSRYTEDLVYEDWHKKVAPVNVIKAKLAFVSTLTSAADARFIEKILVMYLS